MKLRLLALALACLLPLASAGQTPPPGPAGATATPLTPATPPTGTELRRFLEQRNRVVVERTAPRSPVAIEGGRVTVSGLGAFEPGLESQRLLGLRIRVEAPDLEGHEQLYYLDLHEIESLLRGFVLLRTVITEGGRGFPTEARHLSIEGFGVGVALRDGKVSHRVHAGRDGERILALSPDGFQKLETAISSSLDRLFNAP